MVYDEDRIKHKFSSVYFLLAGITISGNLQSVLPKQISGFAPVIASLFWVIFSFAFLRNRIRIFSIIGGVILALINAPGAFGISPKAQIDVSAAINAAKGHLDAAKYDQALNDLQNEDVEASSTKCTRTTQVKYMHTLAQALWRNGRNQSALDVIEKAFKKCDPKDAESLGNLHRTKGNILADFGAPNEAISQFALAQQYGMRDPGLILDKATAESKVNLFNAESISSITDSAFAPKTAREFNIKSNAFRLLSYQANSCKEKANSYFKSYAVLPSEPQFYPRKINSYVDYVIATNACEGAQKVNFDSAFGLVKGMFYASDPNNDLYRLKIYTAVKFAIAYKNGQSSNYKGDSAILRAMEMLNSVSDVVSSNKYDSQARLKWYLQKIDIASQMESLSEIKPALDSAKSISDRLSIYNKAEASAIGEYLQIAAALKNNNQGVFLIPQNKDEAKELYLKAFCIKYLLLRDNLTDFKMIVNDLDSLGVKGLPKQFPAQ